MNNIKNPKDRCEIILDKPSSFFLIYLNKSMEDEVIRKIDDIIIKFEITL